MCIVCVIQIIRLRKFAHHTPKIRTPYPENSHTIPRKFAHRNENKKWLQPYSPNGYSDSEKTA